MPMNVPVPVVTVGQTYTDTMYNNYLVANVNKLLNQAHRVLTVAQFAALTGLEGTKGVVAPDEVYLEVDATNGILWHLAYESGETTYKWRFLGGPELSAEVTTSESTSSSAYVALTTAGPSIAVPRAGDYDMEHGAFILVTGNATAYMSYDIGATGAVDADAVNVEAATASSGGSSSRPRRKTALTAVTLTAKYKNLSSVSTTFSNRWMRIRPVRIS